MKKLCCVLLVMLLACTALVTIAACEPHEDDDPKQDKAFLIWGPEEHKEIYLKYAELFREKYPDIFAGYKFQYEGNGDAGAYSAMNVDPLTGAAIYTFANDQAANLRNLKALAVVNGENLEWSKANNSEASVEATKVGDGYYSYPLQADNGYYMYYNKSAFRGTAVWDNENDCLKDDYTFRDLYAALDEKGGDWANGKVTWAMGDSWYVSGVLFAVGGDYSVIYDADGKQVGADCWFSYVFTDPTVSDPMQGDYTVGNNAYEVMKNSITDADGKVNKHYAYTDGSTAGLNDYIDAHINPDTEVYKSAPLAAAVCGTWKAQLLKERWGDDYAATILPMLENDAGQQFRMKNFAGYKNLGVNPLCQFVSDGATYEEKQERLAILHEMAQFFCSPEMSIERYQATGAGPANLQALADPEIAADAALTALNRQYALKCVYPEGYKGYEYARAEDGSLTLIPKQGGDLVGNGLGYRSQDSVPANYWTPIQTFGQTLFTEFDTQNFTNFGTKLAIVTYMRNLQAEIAQAAQ